MIILPKTEDYLLYVWESLKIKTNRQTRMTPRERKYLRLFNKIIFHLENFARRNKYEDYLKFKIAVEEWKLFYMKNWIYSTIAATAQIDEMRLPQIKREIFRKGDILRGIK